jgi:protocatechuate 3,4-dioxygenase beta subunit
LLPHLDEAVESLPERYRVPIILCYFEDKRVREAAAELGCPASTLLTRLRRARQLLRRRLARYGFAMTPASVGTGLARESLCAAAPTSLVTATAALSMECLGRGLAAAGASSNVLALARSAARTAFATKLKFTIALLATLAMVCGGMVAVAARQQGTATPERPTRIMAALSSAATTKLAGKDRPMVLTGRILAPDGTPVRNGRLYSPHVVSRQLWTHELPVSERGESRADGTFHIELPLADTLSTFELIAVAKGYGPDWAYMGRQGSARELTFHLVNDQAIRGRVLDTQGRPLTKVRLSVVGLGADHRGNLDQFLNAWMDDVHFGSRGWGKRKLNTVTVAPGEVLPHTETDQNGRFEIQGVGAERLVDLVLEGDGVARTQLMVVARTGFDPAPYAQAAARQIRTLRRYGNTIERTPLIYGPDFVFVAKPGRVLEGNVRAEDSHEPIAGATIRARSMDGYLMTRATTEERGRFRFTSLAQGGSHWIELLPKSGTPWLRRSAAVPESPGLGPIHMDVQLSRGVLIAGRVLDKESNGPVSASVQVVPLAGNKFYRTTTGFFDDMTMTDAEGHFQLATLPGLSAIVVTTSTEVLNGDTIELYRSAELNSADRDKAYVQLGNGLFSFTKAAQPESPLIARCAAYKIAEIPEDGASYDLTVFPISQKTLAISIQDPEGKPLPGAVVYGITPNDGFRTAYRLTEPSCTIRALEPGKRRSVLFYHEQQKLARTLNLRGDESKPEIVRLEPTGAVCGRIVDAHGKPVPGVTVQLYLSNQVLVSLFDKVAGIKVTTDRNGRFRTDGLVPDWYFGLSLSQGERRFEIQKRIGNRRVQAGETLDLGEIRGKEGQP